MESLPRSSDTPMDILKNPNGSFTCESDAQGFKYRVRKSHVLDQYFFNLDNVKMHRFLGEGILKYPRLRNTLLE